jgi:hypothetical protein
MTRAARPVRIHVRRRDGSQPAIGIAALHKKFFCQVPEVFPVFLSSYAAS